MEPEAAKKEILKLIIEVGYSKQWAHEVAEIIENSHLAYRATRKLSNESKALADADNLFKVIPTTPVLFASKYITQNKYDIEKLGNKVLTEQTEIVRNKSFFYTKIATKKYFKYAKLHLTIWEEILKSLEDKDVKEMLKTASELDII